MNIINNDILEIKENLKVYSNNKEYPKRPEGYSNENYVYDEDKTVRWNKEHREELIKEYRQKQDEYQKESNRVYEQFKLDLVSALKNRYKLNEKQSEIIFNKAWNEAHSEGLSSIVDLAEDLVELIIDIFDAKSI